MIPHKVLDKRQHVPELRPGETVTFRIIGSESIDPVTKRPKAKSMVSLPATDRIINRYGGNGSSRVRIGNVIGERSVDMPDGSSRFEPILERVRFGETGVLVVGADQQEKYQFLMHHNLNQSNIHRDKKNYPRPLFYVANSREVARKVNDKETILSVAKSIIATATYDQLKPVAKSLGKDATLPFQQLKASLRTLCNNYDDCAKVVRALRIQSNQVKDLQTMVNIYDARQLGYLLWDDWENTWVWNNDARTEIASVSEDDEPILSLASFFKMKSGEIHAQILQEILDGKPIDKATIPLTKKSAS